MPSCDRLSLIAATGALLLSACSRPDRKVEETHEDAAAVESTFQSDPRKASVDTAAAPRAADSVTQQRPDSPARPRTKPPVRMTPGERTDRTPSIPVNPPLVKPD